MSQAPSNWAIAWEPNIRRRALRIAALVGTALIVINHGPALMNEGPEVALQGGRLAQMGLTFLVPYLVSTWSSVQARRDQLSAMEEQP